jgi:hypothetical protein
MNQLPFSGASLSVGTHWYLPFGRATTVCSDVARNIRKTSVARLPAENNARQWSGNQSC